MMDISLQRITALIKKEYFQIIRDPSSILISVILPLMLMFIYGFGVSLDLNHLRIGLVLEDRSSDAIEFANTLTNSPYFSTTIFNTRKECSDEVVRGNIRGFVVIPSYFTTFKKRKDRVAPIQIIADGSETNTANFVQNYVAGAYQTWLNIETINNQLQGFLPLIQTTPRFWYNEELESRNFLIPGSLAIIMALIGTLLTALVVAREWERGTMEALMSTPIRVAEIIIGKLIPYYFLAMFTMTMCTCIAVFLYHVPLRGSLFALFIISSCFLVSALGQGLLISTIAKNQFVAGQLSMFSAFLPAFMLSGFIFEISSMPFIIQLITYFLTPRYFVSALQTLFLVGDVWQLLIYDALIMLFIGCIFFLLTARLTVKRLE